MVPEPPLESYFTVRIFADHWANRVNVALPVPVPSVTPLVVVNNVPLDPVVQGLSPLELRAQPVKVYPVRVGSVGSVVILPSYV